MVINTFITTEERAAFELLNADSSFLLDGLNFEQFMNAQGAIFRTDNVAASNEREAGKVVSMSLYPKIYAQMLQRVALLEATHPLRLMVEGGYMVGGGGDNNFRGIDRVLVMDGERTVAARITSPIVKAQAHTLLVLDRLAGRGVPVLKAMNKVRGYVPAAEFTSGVINGQISFTFSTAYTGTMAYLELSEKLFSLDELGVGFPNRDVFHKEEIRVTIQ